MAQRGYDSPPTFVENMEALYQLKEQALKLHFLYSKEAVNANQLAQLGELRHELHQSQQRLEEYRKQYTTELERMEHDCGKLQHEREDLFNLNHSLVEANEKLAANLNKQTDRAANLEQQLRQQAHRSEQLQLQHLKELENIKLMHAQELYILKKRK